jgi:hypothetical protein
MKVRFCTGAQHLPMHSTVRAASYLFFFELPPPLPHLSPDHQTLLKVPPPARSPRCPTASMHRPTPGPQHRLAASAPRRAAPSITQPVPPITRPPPPLARVGAADRPSTHLLTAPGRFRPARHHPGHLRLSPDLPGPSPPLEAPPSAHPTPARRALAA